MAEPLDALRFPLWGCRLIEASAGTGKTWTIAALYLRLVLGHGEPPEAAAAGQGGSGFGRALLPAEILVMTFTRAATRELSERIRARLIEAARCFRGEAEPTAGDSLLAGLVADYPVGPARMAAAWRLASAAEAMDDAAIHTIDAWCQRMLREHAFDSGCLFDEELGADEAAMRTEAAQDYWRQQVYPLGGPLLDAVLGVWPTVDALLADMRGLAGQALPGDVQPEHLFELIEGWSESRREQTRLLKHGWGPKAVAMRDWLDQLAGLRDCPFDKRSLNPTHYRRWLDTVMAWALDDGIDTPELKTGATRLTPAGVLQALKPGRQLDLPALFAEFEQLQQALAARQPLATPVRLHAAARVAVRLAELKQQAGSFGFADMLERLDRALDPEANGPAAERLRERMLAQHPVALVDEFQDTSPVQARIFDRLYRMAAGDPGHALLLIGDPKQSIYGFRGADIHSYLQARRATRGRHHVLGTNHRSTQGLVAAVNHLFGRAEARPGDGAFGYRGAQDGDDALPFLPVAAQGRREVFVTTDGPCPAMQCVLDPRLDNAQTHRQQFAARCAEQIVRWLNDPVAGFAADPADGSATAFRRLRPADIAVLVRSGTEAAAVRRALRRRRVASVYLSDKESVFASQQARDLLLWLQAVAAPRDARRVRAALATRSLGLDLAELHRLATDDLAYEARAEQLRGLLLLWQRQGVLTMLRRTLFLFDLPARWLGAAADGQPPDPGDPAAGPPGADPEGERQLTNFLHLAELLQQAAARLEGEQALIRWLAGQLAGEGEASEEQVLRLESDADLVQVVTVHKSKGLEYPVVLLPFPWSFRPVDSGRSRFVSLADAAGHRRLVLAPDGAELAEADHERLREDLRLLYVALTRARHAVWLGLAALQVGQGKACQWHRSAVGRLLSGPDPVAAEALPGLLAQATAGCTDLRTVVATLPAASGAPGVQPRGLPAPLAASPPYAAEFDRLWAIGSFSSLVKALPGPALAASAAAALRHDEALPEAAVEPGAVAADAVAHPAPSTSASLGPEDSTAPWHHFPRGAVPGNFLHAQLEWLAAEGFALNASPALQQQLMRRCESQGWGHRAPQVLAWMSALLARPLPPLGAALQDLGTPLPEMEFWFPSEGLASAQLDALCRRHLLGGRTRPALPERALRGMLMGFADLVFEHGGRYWVLDHKSNQLGPHDADYHAEALAGAMAAHRYDVQAAIYLLALHRLLRLRLGAAYDPARQLGGAVYLFLRGLNGPEAGCHLVLPDLALLESLDGLLAGSGEAIA